MRLSMLSALLFFATLIMVMLLLACGAPSAPPLSEVPEASDDRFPTIPFAPSDELEHLHRQAAHPEALRPPRGGEEIWVRDVYTPWMAERTELIALAMRLRRVARSQTNAPPVVAGLHAEILRHTADSLDELDLHEELAEAVKAPVESLRTRALRTYEVCYEGALAAGPAFDGWHRLCGEGLAALSAEER